MSSILSLLRSSVVSFGLLLCLPLLSVSNTKLPKLIITFFYPLHGIYMTLIPFSKDWGKISYFYDLKLQRKYYSLLEINLVHFVLQTYIYSQLAQSFQINALHFNFVVISRGHCIPFCKFCLKLLCNPVMNVTHIIGNRLGA